MYLFLHVHLHCFTQHQINLHDFTLIQSVRPKPFTSTTLVHTSSPRLI